MKKTPPKSPITNRWQNWFQANRLFESMKLYWNFKTMLFSFWIADGWVRRWKQKNLAPDDQSTFCLQFLITALFLNLSWNLKQEKLLRQIDSPCHNVKCTSAWHTRRSLQHLEKTESGSHVSNTSVLLLPSKDNSSTDLHRFFSPAGHVLCPRPRRPSPSFRNKLWLCASKGMAMDRYRFEKDSHNRLCQISRSRRRQFLRSNHQRLTIDMQGPANFLIHAIKCGGHNTPTNWKMLNSCCKRWLLSLTFCSADAEIYLFCSRTITCKENSKIP